MIYTIPLAKRVLAVAKFNDGGDWAAYIDAVPGEDHSTEWFDVTQHGAKLPHHVALVLFSDELREMNSAQRADGKGLYRWRE